MRRRLLILFCAVLIALTSTVAIRCSIGPRYEKMSIAERWMSRAILKEGCIRDKGTAMSVGRAIIDEKYGEYVRGFLLEASYDSVANLWVVGNQLPDHMEGWTFSPVYVILQKSNSKIVAGNKILGLDRNFKAYMRKAYTRKYIRKTVFVSEEHTIHLVSRAILNGTFGILQTDEFPLSVTYNERKKYWVVSTTPSDDAIGGTKYIIIRRSNAEVLAIWHE